MSATKPERQQPGPWTETTWDHNDQCLLLTTTLEQANLPTFDCGCPRTVRDMTEQEIAWFEENITPSLEAAGREYRPRPRRSR